MANIRLVVLDIDWTLTGSVPTDVSQGNLEAIKRAGENGILVTLATGRGYLGSRMIAQAIRLDAPMIVYGGALTVNAVDGKLLRGLFLQTDVIRRILAYANQLGIHAQIYCGDTVTTARDCELFQKYCGRLDLPREIDLALLDRRDFTDVPKILLITQPEEQQAVQALFEARFGHAVRISCSQPGFIEINDPAATKGLALEALAGSLGIPRSEVCAVGDSYLDIDMVEWAGLGACVANSVEEMKAAADLILPAQSEDGVAWLLDRLIANGLPAV